MVVAVKEVASAVPKEEWTEDRLLPGDIIERVTWIDGQLGVAAPFINGKAGLEDELRQMFRTSDLQVWVCVKRAGGVIEELQARIVPEELVIPKKHYTLRCVHDSRHVAYLVDTTEDECLRWQAFVTESTMKVLKKSSKLDVQTVKREKIENVLQSYPWLQKMQAYLPTGTSSMLFSMVFMPFQPALERVQCKCVEDTMARAMTWFSSAQASGVPIIFIGIQTELIFKESSKDVRDFCDAMSKVPIRQATSGGRFRMVCTENTLIDVSKAIRLWYVPPATEVPINLHLEPGEAKFGLSLASTEEGFCHVATVDDGSAAERAGVRYLLELALKENKLLVVSRVGEEKVVPWLATSDGSIHYYGVPTIRETLSQLRSTYKFAQIHLMVWESAPSDVTSENQTINDICNLKKNDVAPCLDLVCIPTKTPTSNLNKSSSKHRTVSWSDSNGSQLATITEF
ncbi:hypothetical protein GOP47_0005322 [Adiantum capillus-veneris]|uniref:Uncharacterized protein n=1 Tax=Adiantum capillus-veneris TaxID=13818 RepID=A0A9D4V546_ADICA|nr:hypothetical protein GOP47_0005322 [Adiantum capillus-veneris]